jgi:hypothetical protein
MPCAKGTPNGLKTDLFLYSSRWKKLGIGQTASLEAFRPKQGF